MNFLDYLNLYWHSWTLEAIGLLVICALVFSNWKKITRLATTHMVLAAFVIWIAGLVLYSIGFAYEGSGKSLTAYTLRAAMASVEMFLSNNELIEVSPHYKESAPYMICFSLVHLSAICLSAILILNTIGFRIKHYFLIWNESLRARRSDPETFIFWGISTPGMSLASSVREKKPEARIIFVRPTSEMTVGERLEVSQMVNIGSSSARSTAFTRSIESIEDAMVLYTSADMADCLRTKRMKRIISATTDINLIFFGSEEKDNIKQAIKVYRNDGVMDISHKNVHIYTLVTLGGHNRVLQDAIAVGRAQGRKMEWSFVDESYLAINSIKRIPEYHPVSSVPEEAFSNGAVDTVFNALVIGFGKNGQELYRFFNEYSSFCTSEGRPTPKNIIIVDKDIESAAGPFCISAPGLFHTDSIRLINGDAGTTGFWRAIKEYATGINCIGIALGNDDLGVSITMDLYKGILQYSTTRPKNVRIYLRVYSQENESGINLLAKNYNAHKKDTGIEIIPYGGAKDIFSYDVIMEKDILKDARNFNYHIGVVRKLNDGIDEVKAWQRDHDFQSHINTFKAVPLAIDEITRKVIQTYSCSLFIGTLLKLAGTDASDRESLERFVELSASRDPESTIYKDADATTQKLMDNLARSAYERTVTSHWLMGYREADQKTVADNPMDSARQKLTPYVKPWETTTEEFRILAYTLVDTSFYIALEHCSQRQ